jgi:RND family efflux transporter MFP subunit
MGAMFIPWPYRVACDCEVQPVMRRFIASPYDGILEKTYTESGELVTKDQIIAHLDGRQLRIELSVLRAEFDGAKKKRDSALAQGDIATSQIARSEMKRHQSKMDIIQQQLKNLEVKSPIDGIVVNGDLEKVEGAPLEMGQTLFEIAPLDEMVSEIGIPESEIQYVKPGMTVAIKLDAFPFRTWEGTIKNIYPRTEVLDDESVFIAQVKLPNELGELRPGMKGSAKITTELSPIGWNLFHRPWESVRYWTIW